MKLLKIFDKILEQYKNQRKIIPNKYVYHKSYKKYRKNILKKGLIPSIGKDYLGYWMDEIVDSKSELIPAIFAVNDEKLEYASSIPDDIWQIDTNLAKVEWYEDLNMGKPFIMTFQKIKPIAIKLIKMK